MISVVIPTHNRRSTLERAIQSVRDQTFRDWELIVVDDGSGDESWRVVPPLGDRRVHYVYQPQRGVSAARNTGIRLARFSWLCFLDSDDYWTRRKLERQLEALEANPAYRAVYTDEIWIRRGQRVNPRKRHHKYSGWIYHRCLPLCIISPSSVMLHRRLLDQEGLFDETLPACEDYDLWLRIACRHPVLFLEQPLVVKTGGHPDQLSRRIWGLDRYRLQALRKMLGSGGLTPQQRHWTAREMARKASILASGFANRGKPRQAGHYRQLAGRAERLLIAWSPAEGRSPHFSHPVCCGTGIIRPDCVALRRPPRRTVQYACGGLGRTPCRDGASIASRRSGVRNAG